MNRKISKNILIATGIVFLAFCVCMLSHLNPFSGDAPQTDSSVFLTIAQGMLRGKLPYRDFFDHKGPLIYFINALGLSLGGMIGVWLVEFFLMTVSAFFAYKIARFFSGEIAALVATGLSFLVLANFFEGGNLTEEYALPCIFVSLYIFTRYCFTRAEPGKMQLAVLGACFGASLLLRPNMFGVWLGFCAVILAQKYLQKDVKTLLSYLLFFIAGTGIVIIPVLLFLQTQNIFHEFLYQYFFFNFSHFVKMHSRPFMPLIEHYSITDAARYTSLLSMIVLLLLFIKHKAQEYLFYVGYFLASILSIFLISLSKENWPHYTIPLVPLFVPALSLCIDKLFTIFSSLSKENWPHCTIPLAPLFAPALSLYIDRLFTIFSSLKYLTIKYCIPIIILSVFFQHDIVRYRWKVKDIVRTDAENAIYKKISNIIDLNTNIDDVISVLGNRCAIYLYTERRSASKYIYQSPILLNTNEERNEYLSDIMSKKPAILILPTAGMHYDAIMAGGTFAPIFSMIDNEYTEILRVGFLIVYRNSAAGRQMEKQ